IEIGPGFVLPHPGGIVLGSARIGRNVTVFQNVTLGARDFDGAYDLAKRPVLEDGCLVGAGAVVLGPIRVGRGATVAANSLALRDVPDGATAIGVPAAIKGVSVAAKDEP
ncbi:MAG: serine O-acetyltransferase, partial [Paracoccaceae bacterium]